MKKVLDYLIKVLRYQVAFFLVFSSSFGVVLKARA